MKFDKYYLLDNQDKIVINIYQHEMLLSVYFHLLLNDQKVVFPFIDTPLSIKKFKNSVDKYIKELHRSHFVKDVPKPERTQYRDDLIDKLYSIQGLHSSNKIQYVNNENLS